VKDSQGVLAGQNSDERSFVGLFCFTERKSVSTASARTGDHLLGRPW
jgi:hypothetical protein